jgi:hypothetical protein
MAAALVAAAVISAHADGTDPAPASERAAAASEAPAQMTLAPRGVEEPQPVIDAACCKVCTTGKACGNSCISRKKICHKPPGCACDAQ